MHDGAQESRVLEMEARLFARYLVGRPPPAELIDRYREAHFLRPGGLLRTKILLMAAILETSPGGADEFFPRPAPPAAFVVRLLGLGAIAVARAALRIVLYPAAARSRP